MSANAACPSEPPPRHALALVQHGNQYLIGGEYPNREGLDELLAAYSALFDLHRRWRAPFNLHLSGTLLEAIAWRRPEFLSQVRCLLDEGLVEWVGSAYAQNILPLFDPAHNRRQLVEALRLYHALLGLDPAAVRVFWLPERVWRPELYALLTDPGLPNGGYRAVLLDDRLAFPLLDGAYPGSPRAEFDAAALPASYQAISDAALLTPDPSPLPPNSLPGPVSPFLIAPPGGPDSLPRLAGLPIAHLLRYCLPPARPAQQRAWEALIRRPPQPGGLLVYGDDLEKSAAVGPWGQRPWSPDQLQPYAAFLERLASTPQVQAVHLSGWLAEHPPQAVLPVEPGAYYELAQTLQAGENYQSWWRGAAYAPYRRTLEEGEAALLAAGEGPPGGLLELAWKAFMASAYETAWHDLNAGEPPRPAPWARALASHARAARVLLAAAKNAWDTDLNGETRIGMNPCFSASSRVPILAQLDLDGDGEAEVLLANERLGAVFTPRWGGRLIYLWDWTLPGGRLVVGNPADDWNWQEALNCFMDTPPHHPGAFTEAGFEHQAWEVQGMEVGGGQACLRLVNATPGSPLLGAVKTFTLAEGAAALEAAYRLPETAPLPLRLSIALAPDYLTLLRQGRPALTRLETATRRGAQAGKLRAWVDTCGDPAVGFEAPEGEDPPHALLIRIASRKLNFRVRLEIETED